MRPVAYGSHGEEEGSALILGIGLRLWQSALRFPSHLLSTFGMVGFLVEVLAGSGGLVHSDCSQRVVVMK
jgi:hypothetical protein